MRTLEDVERRSDEIKARLNQIINEIAAGTKAKRKSDMSGLAEEMAVLLHESKVLATSMALVREMTESLANARCSGPH